jgi:hypothetical protein
MGLIVAVLAFALLLSLALNVHFIKRAWARITYRI